MRLWLVNPFDPPPGEREQLGRYACLAETAARQGHEVVWWSSTFSHRFKRDVDTARVIAAVADRKFDIRFVPTPHYHKNISYRRLRSHRSYARSFRDLALDDPRPDVILASSPPLESAYEAAKLGRAWGVPTVIDIQDQWPDNFARVLPRALRWLSGSLLRPLYTIERKAYTLAHGIIGVAQGYVDRGVEVGGQKKHDGVFPIGVNLEEVSQAIAEGAKRHEQTWKKPADQLWFLYSGSHTVNYDVLTIVRAAALAQERFGDRVRFIFTGTGALAEKVAQIARSRNLKNVTMTGFMEFPQWAYLLSQVDVGFNAAVPDALIYFPNKIFDYLGVGAAVLNTIPGDCERLITTEGCGLQYTAGDPQSCFRAVAQLADSPEDLARMRSASRRLAGEVFDRRIIYADLTRFLEQVAAEGV